MDYNRDADTPGVISMIIVKKNPMLFYQNFNAVNDDNYQRKAEIIQIPITQKELLKIGILPEEIGWEKEKKARIQSSDKVYYAVPDKSLSQKSEFKNLLIELARNGNSNEEKISMESVRKVYKEIKDEEENQR